jgi:hypothetical protein
VIYFLKIPAVYWVLLKPIDLKNMAISENFPLEKSGDVQAFFFTKILCMMSSTEFYIYFSYGLSK